MTVGPSRSALPANSRALSFLLSQNQLGPGPMSLHLEKLPPCNIYKLHFESIGLEVLNGSLDVGFPKERKRAEDRRKPKMLVNLGEK